ncbi:MAG TPA: malto-oligosyltrehalose synthase, partial [Adhaeribacter sp.]|nr:malto-oligosyltrehalose synthase [Adhaeribacter sp.]
MTPFTPSATYRIQFHKEFRFRDLQQHLPYLAELGIDTIYASPIFEARPGSTHGYDVTNAGILNPDLGTSQEFEALMAAVKQHGLHWLQDIVPNHMAFHQENEWLMDIFEHGPESEFYHFFDVNWHHPDARYTGKLMAPFLGTTLEEAVAAGDVKLVVTNSGVKVQFYENQFPLSRRSLPQVITFLQENATQNGQKSAASEVLASGLETYFNVRSTAPKTAHHATLQESPPADPAVVEQLQNAMENLNKSQEKLLAILELQYFRLEFWKVTDQQINYRRFFTINELICLRMERQEVFQAYHKFALELVQKGYFQGLRIDHVDGLADPVAYMHQLREAAGPACYISVEKILELGEELPAGWPVQGTTGYFFLALVNQLFTNQRTEGVLTEIYQKFVPEARETDYEALVFEKKLYMLQNHMQGELDNLFDLLQQLELQPAAPGFSDPRLKEALQMLLAAFPVYRLYTNELPVTGQDAEVLEHAFARAEKFALHLKKELGWFYQLFQGEKADVAGKPEDRLQFLMRCQQFTGPLAAKGVEDTTFYNYNRLISHNEVGDNPEIFGFSVARFHQEMQERQHAWPLAQNATATHDTKRGEDARMRLNVLAEMTTGWHQMLEKWSRFTEPILQFENGQQYPSQNRIYFLYQALLGAFPMTGEMEQDFPERVKEAMTKAVREAKMYSNWSEPNEKYEEDLHAFTEKLLADNSAFLDSFGQFVKRLGFYGMLYSLGQTLLKITAPGIPDIYQGCELWDLSMVDPDNRRPVNYELRKRFLETLKNGTENGRENDLKSMLETWTDGRIKLFLTTQALNFRKANQQLFTAGIYQPLQTSTFTENQVIAFVRQLGNQWCLVAVP